MRGTLPKHGFVRNMPWQLLGNDAHATSQVFELKANDATRSIWPVDFRVLLTVDLQVHQLKISLRVENLGDKPLTFTGALHTYLAVSAIDQVCLQGQAKQAEWDAVQDTHQTCSGQLQFDAEFDRVYDVATTPSTPSTEAKSEQAVPTWILQEGAQTLSISQSNAWGQSVVWNPGPEKTAQLKDMPTNGFQHMLCVEAARVNTPIEVPAFQSWEAWQQFKL
jgi:glucose-6-phosphate 1-epimerase